MNMHVRVIPLDFSGGRFTRDGREVVVVSTLPRTSSAKAVEFRDKEDAAQAKAVGVTTAKLRGFKYADIEVYDGNVEDLHDEQGRLRDPKGSLIGYLKYTKTA